MTEPYLHITLQLLRVDSDSYFNRDKNTVSKSNESKTLFLLKILIYRIYVYC